MNQSQTKRNPITSLALWVIALLLVIEAVGTSIYVPQFSELFKSFGSELPFLTKVVLIGTWVIWVLPVMTVALIVFNNSIKKPPIAFAIIFLVLGVLWVPAVIYGLYLPIWHMSEVEFP